MNIGTAATGCLTGDARRKDSLWNIPGFFPDILTQLLQLVWCLIEYIICIHHMLLPGMVAHSVHHFHPPVIHNEYWMQFWNEFFAEATLFVLWRQHSSFVEGSYSVVLCKGLLMTGSYYQWVYCTDVYAIEKVWELTESPHSTSCDTYLTSVRKNLIPAGYVNNTANRTGRYMEARRRNNKRKRR